MSATTTTQEHKMTLDEAYEYVDQADQMESECRAEYGMGAVSLGLDPYDWAPAYEGYRASTDSTYAEARRVIAELAPPRPVVAPVAVDPDDLPF